MTEEDSNFIINNLISNMVGLFIEIMNKIIYNNTPTPIPTKFINKYVCTIINLLIIIKIFAKNAYKELQKNTDFKHFSMHLEYIIGKLTPDKFTVKYNETLTLLMQDEHNITIYSNIIAIYNAINQNLNYTFVVNNVDKTHYLNQMNSILNNTDNNNDFKHLTILSDTYSEYIINNNEQFKTIDLCKFLNDFITQLAYPKNNNNIISIDFITIESNNFLMDYIEASKEQTQNEKQTQNEEQTQNEKQKHNEKQTQNEKPNNFFKYMTNQVNSFFKS
jgi:hypothetical protein